MQKKSQLLWLCVAGCAALVVMTGANAASRAMTTGLSGTTARMPTMPTMSINTIGTAAVSGVSTPTPNPNPTPTPTPIPTPTPTPVKCPDGSIADSDFTVEACMQSLSQCVQSGTLPHGLNDLFNEDLRNSIINGMGLCASEVDNCIRNVRVDCHNVYDSSVDVWLDFNSRIVQPEYYNFVLRKTGLTPNQAENVCGLLDKNVYGKSFYAVDQNGTTTQEYNRDVSAYNNVDGNGNTDKLNPVGPIENTSINGNTGVDGERGHYARWDATNGVCKLRVAAYYSKTRGNDYAPGKPGGHAEKENRLISNRWLGIGDDKTAEVWQDAGSSFTCNKDLFEFSLMNKTKSVALLGLTTGAVTGASIGAGIGAAHDKKFNGKDFSCEDDKMLKKLYEEIKKSGSISTLNDYLPENEIKGSFSVTQCKAIQDLYKRLQNTKKAVEWCESYEYNCKIDFSQGTEKHTILLKTCADVQNYTVHIARGNVYFTYDSKELHIPYENNDPNNHLQECLDLCKNNNNDPIGTALSLMGSNNNIPMKGDCTFKTLKLANNAKIYTEQKDDSTFVSSNGTKAPDEVVKEICKGRVKTCLTPEDIQIEINELDNVFDSLTALSGIEEHTVLKDAAIGTAIGLGAGGVATAITAFVERNNIHCRVGDGLATVGLGKSYKIDSLKDFYVKWNLRVADTISPTARVTSCDDWIATCALYTNPEECPNVVINYQSPGRNTTTAVSSACIMSGSVCIENRSTAISYGACLRTPVTPPVGPTTPPSNPTVIPHM